VSKHYCARLTLDKSVIQKSIVQYRGISGNKKNYRIGTESTQHSSPLQLGFFAVSALAFLAFAVSICAASTCAVSNFAVVLQAVTAASIKLMSIGNNFFTNFLHYMIKIRIYQRAKVTTQKIQHVF